MKKIGLVQVALWIALGLALIGSLQHMAWAFSSLENGNRLTGWIQAVAIDIGLLGLAYAVQQRKREKRATRWLWIGVGMFSLVSIYGNLLHGLLYAQDLGLGHWQTARPFVLSAVLPLLVLYLTEVVSEDVQHAVQEEQKEQKARDRSKRQEMSSPEAGEAWPYSIGQAQEIRLGQARSSKAKALDTLLDILSEEPDIQVTELSRQIGRSRSTVYTYLDELEDQGQLKKNGQGYIVLAGQ